MSDIDTLLLSGVLDKGLADRGITASSVLQTEAVTQVLGQLAEAINQQVTQLQGQVQQQQSEMANTNKDIQKLIKVSKAVTDVLADNATPMETPEVPETPAEPAPIPDAGNVPPAPDVGNVPPMSAPEMMPINPDMLGALQPRF